MEALFKDSYQKWKETKEKLNLVNTMITNDNKKNGLKIFLQAFSNKKWLGLR